MNLLRNFRRKGAASGLMLTISPAIISGVLIALYPSCQVPVLVFGTSSVIVSAYYFASREEEYLAAFIIGTELLLVSTLFWFV